MKLEKWALVAEIVSGVAVVVTVIFLTLSVRENSRITSASTYAINMAEHNELSRAVFESPDLIRITEAFFYSEEADELDGADRVLLNEYVNSMFRTYESAYYDNEFGLLAPEQWERSNRLICSNFNRAKVAGPDVVNLLQSLMTTTFMEFMRNCPAEVE